LLVTSLDTAHALEPRYARQVTLRGFGLAAQEKLAAARVLIVGAGGLGSPAAMYLAAAGVGTITLVDSDRVDESNLHRQLLYSTMDVGRDKLEAALDRLQSLNPHVRLGMERGRLNASNARALVQAHDVVIDATDNFPTRYAINDACLETGRAFVYGSVARFEGQVSIFAAPDGPCYRCLFPEAPPPGSVPTCAEEGVLGVVPGIIGLHQATEAIKWITGVGTPLVGQLMLLDLLENDSRCISVPRRTDCSCSRPASAGASSPMATPAMTYDPDIEPTELSVRLARRDAVTVLDVREQWEYDTAHIEGSVLIPLGGLPQGAAKLDPAAEYVTLCHHGMRSDMAANWLRQHGFTKVRNLVGGIDAYSAGVDPSIPRY
jgi:sulfur-carrier protein adenylyltransferase/sulfurtransferase